MTETATVKKILIAEDEKALSRALTLKLQNAGFEVKVVENGEEAVNVMKAERFDLLLLDLVMPKKNGFAVLQEMRDSNINVPTIVLSNLGQAEDREKVLKLGAIDFLSKSNIPINDVVKKIQIILNVKM
jgi:DNA-binding response OmpR family regulator